MEGRLDHLEKELSDWEGREQKFKKLFGSSVVDSKAFLKEKLAFYEMLELKYDRKGPGFDRMGAQIIKQEKNRLERKVYPNLWARLVYKLIAAIVNQQQVVRTEKRQEENYKALQAKVSDSGFQGLETTISQKAGLGLKEFTIPVSELIREDLKMDYELKFQRGIDRNYTFEGYGAQLTSGQQNEARTCFVEGSTLKPEQALNLLSGRPVLKTGSEGRKWIQIDLNDKDAKGNLKVRAIPRETGFDLSASLDKLPLKNAGEVKQAIIAGLEKGHKVRAVMEIKGKEHICNLIANPLRKEVSIFNEKNEQLAPSDLKQKTKLTVGETKEIEKANRKQMKVAR